jgi:hypothetical protein
MLGRLAVAAGARELSEARPPQPAGLPRLSGYRPARRRPAHGCPRADSARASPSRRDGSRPDRIHPTRERNLHMHSSLEPGSPRRSLAAHDPDAAGAGRCAHAALGSAARRLVAR